MKMSHFLKSLHTSFQPNLPPPSLPKPSCLPHPSQHPASPPRCHPRRHLPPPSPRSPASRSHPRPWSISRADPLPGPGAHPLPSPARGLQPSWGKGQADGERRGRQSCPRPPPSHKTNARPAPSWRQGQGCPRCALLPARSCGPPGPGARWAIGGHSRRMCGEHGHGSVQLGKAPDGHFTLLLVGHQLLEMQGTPSDEAEGRADGP